jgi:hypothetical protein
LRNAITRFAGAFPMSMFSVGRFATGKPKIIIDSPSHGQTIQDLVLIEFHTENIRIGSPFSEPADIARGNIGHLQIIVDGGSCHRIYSTPHPVAIAGLVPGAHSMDLRLEDSHHKALDSKRVQFTIREQNDIPRLD